MINKGNENFTIKLLFILLITLLLIVLTLMWTQHKKYHNYQTNQYGHSEVVLISNEASKKLK